MKKILHYMLTLNPHCGLQIMDLDPDGDLSKRWIRNVIF